MSKILKFILISFLLIFSCIFFKNQVLGQAGCTNPVFPTEGQIDIPIPTTSTPLTLDWCSTTSAQSYYIRILEDGEIYYAASSSGSVSLLDVLGGLFPLTTYEWEMAACSHPNLTNCGVACNNASTVQQCADFSERWSFTTETKEITPPTTTKPFYDPGPPEVIPIVNMSDFLKWERAKEWGWWARSWYYEIKSGASVVVAPTLTNSSGISFSDIWNLLSFDRQYNWHVKSCLIKNGSVCSGFGETWYFKTTGKIPTGLSHDETVFPIKLSWDDVEGAAVYKYQVSSNSGFTNIAKEATTTRLQASINYPTLDTSTTYWWRVRTCADEEGSVCSGWSSSQNFTTLSINVPSLPYPENNGTLFTYENVISWSSVPGANFYEYRIDYVSKSPDETNINCIDNQALVPLTIISSSSVFVPFKCLGTYNWLVRACLDEDCNEAGDWSPVWSFNYNQPLPPPKFGFVPCARNSDNPVTPWNEREACQFKHIFITARIILDFLLWRLGIIALVFLMIASFFVSYFSFGSSTTPLKIKSIWKAAGLGYLIMFFAWIVVNFILMAFGFSDIWWVISF